MRKTGLKVIHNFAQACQSKLQTHEVLPALMRGGVLIQGNDVRAIAMDKLRYSLDDARLVTALNE